ncbi:MAG: hypothetical protein LRY75_17730 [Shewanella xiamenensis]|nr:hypothetical protein [Shewanella xiamenensis]
MKNFVGVRTHYYKYAAAVALLDHVNVYRDGFTKSANVVRPELAVHNAQYVYQNASRPLEALDIVIERHTRLKGKRPRSDFNMLFEHVLILSEEQYSLLEKRFGTQKVAKGILRGLQQYAEQIKTEFGFEPLAISLHLDEGHEKDVFTKDGVKKTFIRNVHAHIDFYNYDFQNDIAPLRHLMQKGQDENGRTNQLNPNFVRMQDIAGEVFKSVGFHRGVSKLITGKKHLKKERFVLQKLAETEANIKQSEQQIQQKAAIQAQLNSDIELQLQEKLTLAKEIAEKRTLRDKLDRMIDQLKEKAYSLTAVQLRKLMLRFKPTNNQSPRRQR